MSNQTFALTWYDTIIEPLQGNVCLYQGWQISGKRAILGNGEIFHDTQKTFMCLYVYINKPCKQQHILTRHITF